jgi:hypothetical protein
MNVIEIKAVLAAATPDWHYNGNEIVSKRNLRMGIGGFLTDEDNRLAANAPEWLASLVSEVERLKQLAVAEIEKKDRELEKAHIHGLKLSGQVEELQKTLEWYACKSSYQSGPIVDGIGYDAPEVMEDSGERARNTLKSIKGEQP